LQNPECVGDFLGEALHLFGIDALNFLEQAEIVTQLFGDFDERAQVLRKATAPEAQTGVEKSSSDARVHADAVGDFLHVGACSFANDRNRVDVGNLPRQKGVGGVLDQLRGVDVGHNVGR